MKILLLVLMVSFALPLAAQAFEPVTCDATELETVLAQIDEQRAAISTEGVEEALAALQDLGTFIQSEALRCNGLVLRGEPEAGRDSIVLGPLTIPDGIYRATLTTPDSILITYTELEGDCNINFAIFDDDAANGTEEVIEVESCRVVLEIKATAAWELVLEPLS